LRGHTRLAGTLTETLTWALTGDRAALRLTGPGGSPSSSLGRASRGLAGARDLAGGADDAGCAAGHRPGTARDGGCAHAFAAGHDGRHDR